MNAGSDNIFCFLLWYNAQVNNFQSVGSHRLLCVTCKPYHWELKRFSRSCIDVHVAKDVQVLKWYRCFLGLWPLLVQYGPDIKGLMRRSNLFYRPLEPVIHVPLFIAFLAQEYFAVKLTS